MDKYKYDDGKPRLDLVPPELIEAVGAVRTYGAQKYGDSDSWKKVEPHRYAAALMRHLCKWLKDPEDIDEESGLPHLWHVGCNVAFLIALKEEARKDEKNDISRDCYGNFRYSKHSSDN